MAKVLIVGCGDLGTEIMKLLAAAGHELYGVRLSSKSLPNNLPCIQADVTQPASLEKLKQLQPNIVIYCVAASAQTDDSYRAHYVDGLSHVLATQVSNPHLQHVFFVSSTRVYGQVSSEVLNETMPALPNDFGGERLLEGESLLNKLACGTTTIRLSGIYGAGRLFMVNLAKHTDRWPQVNRWTNRIHRDDAARFIAFLCEKTIAGATVQDCYIGTDDMPVLQYDVLSWLAQQLNIAVPAKPVGVQIEGKRLSNQRMHDEGFQLKYPNYQFGYSEILKDG
jgi:nucleoside-diphosphate-sugar epimerase